MMTRLILSPPKNGDEPRQLPLSPSRHLPPWHNRPLLSLLFLNQPFHTDPGWRGRRHAIGYLFQSSASPCPALLQVLPQPVGLDQHVLRISNVVHATSCADPRECFWSRDPAGSSARFSIRTAARRRKGRNPVASPSRPCTPLTSRTAAPRCGKLDPLVSAGSSCSPGLPSRSRKPVT